MRLPISMSRLREGYQRGENIMQILRSAQSSAENTPEAILAAYDLQAGSYTSVMRDSEYAKKMLEYGGAIARLIEGLGGSSILEAGVGEATTLSSVVQKSSSGFAASGFDISWSRIACGRQYAREQGVDIRLFIGNLFSIPCPDDTVDVVYTSHSIEPNRGREREAIRELYRVARRFVVLLEPGSALGNEETKARIAKHGYCTELAEHARALGLRVAMHRLFEICLRHDNQTELIVIEKDRNAAPAKVAPALACPNCRSLLISHREQLYCESCCLVFPVVGDVPCLLPEQGILASKFPEF